MTIEHKLRELVDLWRRRVGPVFCVGFTGTGLCAQELESILNEASIQTEGDTVNRALAAYNEHMADESHGKPCQFVAMSRALAAAPAVVDEVTDDMVHVAAIAIMETRRPHPNPVLYWTRLHEDDRVKLRDQARAALAAALRKG